MYKSFSDMPVWQKAHELSVNVFHLTVNLPKSEDTTTSQIEGLQVVCLQTYRKHLEEERKR